jgi:hypothetical protein
MVRRIRRCWGATSHRSSVNLESSEASTAVGTMVGVGTMPDGIRAGGIAFARVVV